LLLWGVDELITYHYLIAEMFRYDNMPYEQYFSMPKREQADLIWKTLFLDRSPVSEAQRGVPTVMSKLGILAEKYLDVMDTGWEFPKKKFAKMWKNSSPLISGASSKEKLTRPFQWV